MKILTNWQMEQLLKCSSNGLYCVSVESMPVDKIFKEGEVTKRKGGVILRKHEKQLLLISEDFAQINYLLAKDVLFREIDGFAFYWHMPLPDIELWRLESGTRTRYRSGININDRYPDKFESVLYDKFGFILENALLMRVLGQDFLDWGDQNHQVFLKNLKIKQ